jgi:hypothetical protein
LGGAQGGIARNEAAEAAGVILEEKINAKKGVDELSAGRCMAQCERINNQEMGSLRIYPAHQGRSMRAVPRKRY